MKQVIVIGALFVATSLLAGCKPKEPKVEVPQTRETIAVKFAAVDLGIHEARDHNSPFITKYRITEPVSIVSENEGWSEVKLAIDKFGWVETNELVADKHEVGSSKDNIRFCIPPEVIADRGRRGSVIWLKVSVGSFGDVTDVRTFQNTTGKKELAEKHTAAIRKAKFFPMMDEGGTTKPFSYDYKVEY